MTIRIIAVSTVVAACLPLVACQAERQAPMPEPEGWALVNRGDTSALFTHTSNLEFEEGWFYDFSYHEGPGNRVSRWYISASCDDRRLAFEEIQSAQFTAPVNPDDLTDWTSEVGEQNVRPIPGTLGYVYFQTLCGQRQLMSYDLLQLNEMLRCGTHYANIALLSFEERQRIATEGDSCP